MNNVYYIENNNLYLIKNKINELNKEEKYEVIFYDASLKDYKEVIEELDTYNFLVQHKLIVLTSCSFLSTTIKKKEEHELEALVKYINHPNPDHILILSCEKLSDKNSIVSQLKKQGKKLEVEVNIKDLIKTELQDYTYDFDFIRTLLEYTNHDIDLTMSEVKKLKLYKKEEKKLTKEDVVSAVRRNIDDSDQMFFSLIDHIINKNIKRALEIYRDLKNANIEETKIIATLASQLRLMFQVKCLENYTDKDIADITKAKPYPIKKAKERAYSYSKEQIAMLLNDLFEMDFKIKTSNIDKSLALEMFIYKQK